MPNDLLLLLLVAGAVYAVIGAVVARRSWRWNRGRDRTPGASLAVATVAAVAWPLTLVTWDTDWLVTGRRSWRGDR